MVCRCNNSQVDLNSFYPERRGQWCAEASPAHSCARAAVSMQGSASWSPGDLWQLRAAAGGSGAGGILGDAPDAADAATVRSANARAPPPQPPRHAPNFRGGVSRPLSGMARSGARDGSCLETRGEGGGGPATPERKQGASPRGQVLLCVRMCVLVFAREAFYFRMSCMNTSLSLYSELLMNASLRSQVVTRVPAQPLSTVYIYVYIFHNTCIFRCLTSPRVSHTRTHVCMHLNMLHSRSYRLEALAIRFHAQSLVLLLPHPGAWELVR